MPATQTAPAALHYRTMSLPTATRRGLRAQVWTVDDLAALHAVGAETSLWVSFGSVNGSERFATERLIRTEAGFTQVAITTGAVVASYPMGQGRTLRILVR